MHGAGSRMTAQPGTVALLIDANVYNDAVGAVCVLRMWAELLPVGMVITYGQIHIVPLRFTAAYWGLQGATLALCILFVAAELVLPAARGLYGASYVHHWPVRSDGYITVSSTAAAPIASELKRARIRRRSSA